jgi:hypothetical protein
MLLLKRTFPGPLARFCRYAYSRHQFDGFDPHASGAAVSRILELNALDLRLYERAVELFERRFQDMLSRVPLQVAHDRFVPSAGAPGLFTLQRVEPMPSPTDLRGGEEEQEDEDDEAEGQQGRIPRDMRPQKQEGVPKAVLGISNRRKVFAKDSWPPCRPVRVVSSADVKEEEGSPALLEQALERHRTLPRIQVPHEGSSCNVRRRSRDFWLLPWFCPGRWPTPGTLRPSCWAPATPQRDAGSTRPACHRALRSSTR